jgi:hypothetical protein
MIKAALLVTGGLVATACYFHGPQILAHLQALYNGA